MKAFCKKCLLEQIDPDGLFRSIKERVALLDETVRADESTYNARLEKCRECVRLSSGMCELCGCFVELRAAKKDMYCPDTPSRWKKYEPSDTK